MEITVRNAMPGDLEALVAIYNQAIHAGLKTGDTTPVSVEVRSSWMKEHGEDPHPILVAELHGSIVGYLAISPYRKGRAALDRTVEVSYYVAFDHHRRGIGKVLMERGLEACLHNRIKTVIAIVIDRNLPSRGLLERFGFSLWGTLPNVVDFGDREFDHLYFGKRIS